MRHRTWLRLLALAVALVGAWRLGTWMLGDRGAPPPVANQLWVERMPHGERDLVGHFLLIDHDGQRVGAAGRSSRWQVQFDLFLWGLAGDQLRARFPQRDARVSYRVRSWRCEGEAPRPFDLCLKLSRGARSVTLYSRKDWVVRPGAATMELDWLVPDPLRMPPGAPIGDGADTPGASPSSALP